MEVQLDMYQTLAASVLVLMLGSYLKQQIHVLEKFCIPAPVVGGLLFAIVTCICYSSGFMEISFDDTLREVCMVFFFSGKSEGVKEWWKVAGDIFRVGHSPDRFTESACNRNIPSAWH